MQELSYVETIEYQQIPTNIGLQYTDGEAVPTDDDYMFEIGEKIRLEFTVPANDPILSYITGNELNARRLSFFEPTSDPRTADTLPYPVFSMILEETQIQNETAAFFGSIQTDSNAKRMRDTSDWVIRVATPHVGRRAQIIIAVKDALEKIKMGHPIGNQLAWFPDENMFYSMSVKSVLLDPIHPTNLDRDGLLPALIITYGDGLRNYTPTRRDPNTQQTRRTRNSFNNLNEVEETVEINVRAVLRPNLQETEQIAEEGALTGDALTISTANLHEAVDNALGDGLNLHYRGERIEEIRELKVMRWATPYDMWQMDYQVLDIPVQITHVFTRGKGV